MEKKIVHPKTEDHQRCIAACTNRNKTDENFDWRQCECNAHTTFKRKFQSHFAQDNKGGVHLSPVRGALQTVNINVQCNPLEVFQYKVKTTNSAQKDQEIKDTAVVKTKELMFPMSEPPDDQLSVHLEKMTNSSDVSVAIDVPGEIVRTHTEKTHSLVDDVRAEMAQLRTVAAEAKERADEANARSESTAEQLKRSNAFIISIQQRKLIYIARELVKVKPELARHLQGTDKMVKAGSDVAHEFADKEEFRTFLQEEVGYEDREKLLSICDIVLESGNLKTTEKVMYKGNKGLS